MPRILLLNPNTTAELTDLMLASALRAAGPGTELVPMTAPRGLPYVSTQAEAQIAGAIVLEMLADSGPLDAAIIAAFGDPGLLGARELFPFPVVGLAEAAMLTACMLGRRFGIVTFSGALAPWYRDTVRLYGLAERCAGVFPLGGGFTSITDVQGEKEELLVGLARHAAEAGSDVLIFAGAPLSGLAARVADRLPVPAVEQMAAAVRQAETLALLRAVAGPWPHTYPAKPTSGLPEALAATIEQPTAGHGSR
jgi:Asp/Glu/hydantoin racemase